MADHVLRMTSQEVYVMSKPRAKEKLPKIPGFKRGDVVAIAAHLDEWHRGDKKGRVVKVGGRFIKVKLCKTKAVVAFHYCYLENLNRKARDYSETGV